ncbi:MAG: prepilin-type N-terminal cleavage/methylation domain-containing protein [Candidatus Methylacidiphilales bacterium]|nr:prepilin-type N-terminal cleavage/methylation domain-containing protein [Candidatus Methylacidiphilales bacterium]
MRSSSLYNAIRMLWPVFFATRGASARNRRAGFSLIEITMSIGIMAFGALSILGGMGVGLISLKDARSIQTQATIVAQVRGKLQQMSLTETTGPTSLTTFVSAPLYFSNEGIPTTLTSTDMPAYYTVSLTQGDAAVKGNTGDTTFLSKNAQSVKLTISYPIGAISPTVNEIPLLLARQRQ